MLWQGINVKNAVEQQPALINKTALMAVIVSGEN